MTSQQLDNLFATVNKKSMDNNIWFSAINLSNAYFTYFFDGTECENVKKIYAEKMFVYILEHLNNGITERLQEKTLTNFMDEIRKITLTYRQQMFQHWLACVIDKKQHSDNVVQYLLTFFPSVSLMKNVKEQLGLNYKIG